MVAVTTMLLAPWRLLGRERKGCLPAPRLHSSFSDPLCSKGVPLAVLCFPPQRQEWGGVDVGWGGTRGCCPGLSSPLTCTYPTSPTPTPPVSSLSRRSSPLFTSCQSPPACGRLTPASSRGHHHHHHMSSFLGLSWVSGSERRQGLAQRDPHLGHLLTIEAMGFSQVILGGGQCYGVPSMAPPGTHHPILLQVLVGIWTTASPPLGCGTSSKSCPRTLVSPICELP